MRQRVLVIGCVALGAVVGCSDQIAGRSPLAVVEITIVPEIIAIGEQAQATAIQRRENGTVISSSQVHFTYTSGNPAVATVDRNSGLIAGLAPGRAAVFAESRGRRVSDTVEVVARRE